MATGRTMRIATRGLTDQCCSGGDAFDDYHGASRRAEVRHVRDIRQRGARVLNVEDIQIPAAFEWPVALKYVRSSVLDMLREYQVGRAGVRTSEPMAQSLSVERIQIEGVIQETFASSSLEGYFAGPIAVGQLCIVSIGHPLSL
jgi:hypothetical protein